MIHVGVLGVYLLSPLMATSVPDAQMAQKQPSVLSRDLHSNRRNVDKAVEPLQRIDLFAY